MNHQSFTINYLDSVQDNMLVQLENTLFTRLNHIDKMVEKALQLPEKFDFEYFDAMEEKRKKIAQSHAMITEALEKRICKKNHEEILVEILLS